MIIWFQPEVDNSKFAGSFTAIYRFVHNDWFWKYSSVLIKIFHTKTARAGTFTWLTINVVVDPILYWVYMYRHIKVFHNAANNQMNRSARAENVVMITTKHIITLPASRLPPTAQEGCLRYS